MVNGKRATIGLETYGNRDENSAGNTGDDARQTEK